MKRWAIITVLLYTAMLLILTVPMLLLLGLKWSWTQPGGIEATVDIKEALWIFKEWSYWLWLGIMVAGQALMLFVPVGLGERRPITRRKVMIPIVTSAFFAAILLFSGFVALMCGIFGDDAFDIVFSGKYVREVAQHLPVLRAIFKDVNPGSSAETRFALTVAIGGPVLLWVLWGMLFYRYARTDDPAALNRRLTRALLRGSILELLVAVPSHVYVRGRDQCCAVGATFWGIVTGLAVMLLAFGPGVFYLFAERIQRLQPRSQPKVEPPV